MELQQSNATISEPTGDFNFMRLRLETEDFIKNIVEGLLGGYVYIGQDEEGNIKKTFIKTGEKLVNFIGAGSIEKILRLHVNPHTVQGNFPTRNKISDRFETMLEKFQVVFGASLVANKHKWEFDMSNHDWLVMSIRDSVEMFLSRCLDNLEREGYNQTTKSVETSTTQQRGGMFGGRQAV